MKFHAQLACLFRVRCFIRSNFFFLPVFKKHSISDWNFWLCINPARGSIPDAGHEKAKLFLIGRWFSTDGVSGGPTFFSPYHDVATQIYSAALEFIHAQETTTQSEQLRRDPLLGRNPPVEKH